MSSGVRAYESAHVGQWSVVWPEVRKGLRKSCSRGRFFVVDLFLVGGASARAEEVVERVRLCDDEAVTVAAETETETEVKGFFVAPINGGKAFAFPLDLTLARVPSHSASSPPSSEVGGVAASRSPSQKAFPSEKKLAVVSKLVSVESSPSIKSDQSHAPPVPADVVPPAEEEGGRAGLLELDVVPAGARTGFGLRAPPYVFFTVGLGFASLRSRRMKEKNKASSQLGSRSDGEQQERARGGGSHG